MKFYCDKCHTKYGIADEKVRGKVLKVRCKKCDNVITVREPTEPVRAQQVARAQAAPARSQRRAAVQPPAAPGVAWHYSVNGQSFGPYPFAELSERFASGDLGDECYVWTDSYAGWKPVREAAEFASALDRGQKLKPRNQTIGISQGIAAVSAEDLQRHKEAEKARQAEEDANAQASRKTVEAQQAREAEQTCTEDRSKPAQRKAAGKAQKDAERKAEKARKDEQRKAEQARKEAERKAE